MVISKTEHAGRQGSWSSEPSSAYTEFSHSIPEIWYNSK